MYDLDKDIRKFHRDCVALNKTQQDEMRARRDANRSRVTTGLLKDKRPTPIKFLPQGSYSMHTMVQDPNKDYDIDDGLVFDKKDLVGSQGAYIAPLAARKMVRDAVDDGRFNRAPEVKKNCVRIFYDDGSHVDMPVYRELEDGTLELASSCWKDSNPDKVTEWFNNAVIEQSPDEKDGRQMRRVVKLIKMFCKSRASWKDLMPSGFIISVLVDERYAPNGDRDDESFYDTMVLVRDRLQVQKTVWHPLRNEELTKGPDDPKTKFLLKRLNWALSKLAVLHDNSCTETEALRAWNAVFDHGYFVHRMEEEKEKKKSAVASALRLGNAKIGVGTGLAGIATQTSAGDALKTTRAYSDRVRS